MRSDDDATPAYRGHPQTNKLRDAGVPIRVNGASLLDSIDKAAILAAAYHLAAAMTAVGYDAAMDDPELVARRLAEEIANIGLAREARRMRRVLGV